MKKLFYFIIGIIISLFISSFAFASTLQDSFTNANTGSYYMPFTDNNHWRSQSYLATTTSDYVPTSVKVKLSKNGTVGTLTISLRETDGSGFPTGSNLCSGTYNATTLPEAYAGVVVEINLTNCPVLTKEVHYAIVFNYSWNWDNFVASFYNSSGGYGDGSVASSTDGTTWGSDTTGYDLWFQVWGNATGGGGGGGAVATTDLNWPEILIFLFAVFLICFTIDRGGDKIIKGVERIYQYKIK